MKKSFQDNIDKNAKTIFALISTEVEEQHRPILENWAKMYIAKFIKIARTRGERGSILYFKEVRLSYTRYLSGTCINPGELSFTIGLDKSKFPKILGKVKNLVSRVDNPRVKALVLSVLSIGRTFELSPEFKPLDSITKPFTPKCKMLDFEKELFNTAQAVKNKLEIEDPLIAPFAYHATGSSGPHGPALRTSLWESSQLPDGLLHAISVLQPRVREDIRKLQEYLPDLKTSSSQKFYEGRLSIIPDKEGKTRVITLMNYWSQACLKPYHDYVMDVLKALPWDVTFKQDSFKSVLKLRGNNSYHSIDLKDATDRFPIHLQEIVFSAIFDSTRSKEWRRVISPQLLSPFKDRLVEFSAGQPMGAYSSWPMFALTHGLVLSTLLGAKFDGQFCILGDDVVICDDDLANRYRAFLDNYDIPYSPTKTMVSKHTFEFAKRWYNHNFEISPFPLGALHENITAYPCLWETFRTATEKGWFTKITNRPGLITKILKFHGLKPVFLQRLERKIKAFSQFPFDRYRKEPYLWINYFHSQGISIRCTQPKFEVKIAKSLMATYMQIELLTIITGLNDEIQEFFDTVNTLGFPISRKELFSPESVSHWSFFPLIDILTTRIIKYDRDTAERYGWVPKSAELSPFNMNRLVRDLADLKTLSIKSLAKERVHIRILKIKSKMMEAVTRNLREKLNVNVTEVYLNEDKKETKPGFVLPPLPSRRS